MAYIDMVIYHGEERSINFRELDIAALGIALEVSASESAGDTFGDLEATIEDGRLVQGWTSEGKKLTLSIPVKPDRIGLLQKTHVTLIGDKPPWEIAKPSLKR